MSFEDIIHNGTDDLPRLSTAHRRRKYRGGSRLIDWPYVLFIPTCTMVAFILVAIVYAAAQHTL